MRGLYKEGDAKFSLYPEDIVIFEVSSPWSVEFIYAIRAPFARLLTWPIYDGRGQIEESSTTHCTGRERSQIRFPIISPECPKPVPFSDECLHIPEVKQRYESDLQEANACQGRYVCASDGTYNDAVELMEHMERVRVFPKLYSMKNIYNDIQRRKENNSLFDISL